MDLLAEAGLDILWQHKEGGVRLLSVFTDANTVLDACSNLRMPPSDKPLISALIWTHVVESSAHECLAGSM